MTGVKKVLNDFGRRFRKGPPGVLVGQDDSFYVHQNYLCTTRERKKEKKVQFCEYMCQKIVCFIHTSFSLKFKCDINASLMQV